MRMSLNGRWKIGDERRNDYSESEIGLNASETEVACVPSAVDYLVRDIAWKCGATPSTVTDIYLACQTILPGAAVDPEG